MPSIDTLHHVRELCLVVTYRWQLLVVLPSSHWVLSQILNIYNLSAKINLCNRL